MSIGTTSDVAASYPRIDLYVTNNCGGRSWLFCSCQIEGRNIADDLPRSPEVVGCRLISSYQVVHYEPPRTIHAAHSRSHLLVSRCILRATADDAAVARTQSLFLGIPAVLRLGAIRLKFHRCFLDAVQNKAGLLIFSWIYGPLWNRWCSMFLPTAEVVCPFNRLPELLCPAVS